MRPADDRREVDDHILWRQASEGSAKAFASLYRRHFDSIFSYCLRRTAEPELAEDLAATTFLEAWRQRRRISLDTYSARPLLLGVATNLLRHHWRAKRRHEKALMRLRGSTSAGDLTMSDDDVIARLDARMALREARSEIEALPRREREVLGLIAWADLTYEETAAALKVPVGTVRSRLARARKRLLGMPRNGSSRLLSADQPEKSMEEA